MDIPPVVYKALPIIIILLISWLFGMIGAKRKNPTEEQGHEPDQAENRTHGPVSLSDLFLPALKDQSPSPLVTSDPSKASVHTGFAAQGLDYSSAGGGPAVTPDPIEPSWWGS